MLGSTLLDAIKNNFQRSSWYCMNLNLWVASFNTTRLNFTQFIFHILTVYGNQKHPRNMRKIKRNYFIFYDMFPGYHVFAHLNHDTAADSGVVVTQPVCAVFHLLNCWTKTMRRGYLDIWDDSVDIWKPCIHAYMMSTNYDGSCDVQFHQCM